MNIEPITVSQLNKYVKDKVAEDEYLNNVFVKGEISNFKHHYTGHMYFTLKDEKSLIKCIMFKSQTATLNFLPKDGMKVNVLGTVSVFERDGIYQIYCKAMQEDGVGDLYAKYQKLKKELEEEGLFDEKYKKKIPFMPEKIGVLTSKTGSVIRDIINVSTRRNPNVYIRLYPVPVQGEGAGIKIAEAIRFMNKNKLADVIILAIGGGSLEDLWPFNEECVARAIFESEIPIISAVGHETDFSISDFVADLRAPTPSAAAELAVTDVYELKNKIANYENRFRIILKKKVELMRLRFEKCMNSKFFKDPMSLTSEESQKLDNAVQRLETSIKSKIKDYRIKAVEYMTKIDMMSPLKTLSRGYSITESEGKIIKSSKELKKDMIVKISFEDGKKQAQIL